ncbi:DinB family protein [Pedobacter sp. SYSU D00535]|uniref:DinB family protein n=1 Tax=Pedobacter sp. SYSU D00535 TaxID=2810308 RepID=UPI001A96AF9C|nr:DinB family protein [Pedobacter sp. SYSU D00535]
MNRPQADEYAAFYQKYIETVGDDVLEELKVQPDLVTTRLGGLPAEKADYAYAEGKWTIKELVGHMIDTERVMAYRLLRVSRNDDTPLPGFDENTFVSNSTFKSRDLGSLIEEFATVRKANLYLIGALSEEQLNRRGTASNCPVTTRSLLFIMAGHVKHHLTILQDRYL